MRRRQFLRSCVSGAAAAAAAVTATAAAAAPTAMPLGLNTYCLRAMGWHDTPLLDYANSLRLDSMFLQDSQDPGVMDPAHWTQVRNYAAKLGIKLETGGPALLPKTPDAFEANVAALEKHIDRARGMGSPHVRCLIASDRASMPPGPLDAHIETVLRIMRRVRTRALDAGVKLALENHKDVQAWMTRQVIESAGKDLAGSYLDTGNPVFVAEDPMTTVEELGPVALCVHLRDSVVYEHPGGIAVQWVPLGEGTVDFTRIMAKVREVCPPGLSIYVKPITGRPPAVLPVYDDAFWKLFPNARTADFSRFVALARRGRPYEQHVVIEDIPGRRTPEAFVPAVQYQQREHMERSIAYAKNKLGLGIRTRTP